jgi:hypothetical protein
MTKLNKGAVPRLTQEIYFKCSSNGSKKINRQLTLKSFDKKLGELMQSTEIK